MNIAEVPDVVKKFWDATATPLARLAGTLVVLVYVLGLHGASQKLYRASSSSNLIPSATAKDAMQYYGIGARLPMALLVAIIALAHANDRLVRTLGEIAPGHLILNSTNLLVKNNVERDLLLLMRTVNQDLNLSDALITTSAGITTSIEPTASGGQRTAVHAMGKLPLDANRHVPHSNFVTG